MTSVNAQYAVVPDQNRLEIAQEVLDIRSLPANACLIEAEMTVVQSWHRVSHLHGHRAGRANTRKLECLPLPARLWTGGKLLTLAPAVDRVHAGDRVFCFGKHASYQFYSLVAGKPITAILRVPEDVPASHLAMLRMGLVAIHAPQLTMCRPGDT